MIAGDGKLITGGTSQSLCLWSVAAVAHLKSTEDHKKYAIVFLIFSEYLLLFIKHYFLFFLSYFGVLIWVC